MRARTTTTRVAPAVQHLVQVRAVDAADGEPGPVLLQRGRVPDQLQAGGVAAGLGGGGPAGAGAEVVHAGLGHGRVDLVLRVAGAADEHSLAEDGAGRGDGDVALAEVQDVGADGVRDVGAVVHGEELAVAACGLGENLEVFELLPRLHALVPQLDDVHACGQDGVEELGEVTLPLAGVRAEVEPGVGQLHG